MIFLENNSRAGILDVENIDSGSLEFIIELTQHLYEREDQEKSLTSILGFVGKYLNACRVTLTFGDTNDLQELAWINTDFNCDNTNEKFTFPLKKSGTNSKLNFYFVNNQKNNSTLLTLISTLIDTSLAYIRNIRLEHSQRQLAESINQISKILTSTLNRDELLSLFLDQLETLVPYDSATVMLLEDGLLSMHASRGFEHFKEPMDSGYITFDPKSTFLMEEVLSGTQPVILEDARNSPEWYWAPCGTHVRSWMGVPLRVKGNILGLFSIDKTTPNFFTEKHAQLASVLSKHTALALDNSLLFTQLQEAHEQLRGLSAKIITAQEKERQKIAMELHDHTGQALLALRAELRVLKHLFLNHPEKATNQIEYLDQIALDLSKDLTQLAYDLRPTTLTALGLVSSLDQYIKDFERRMNIKADFVVDRNEEIRLPDEIEIVCYRIIQEALTNLVKHSHADHVEIRLILINQKLKLIVKDNGIGFSNLSIRDKRGFGLIGIRERLSQINGSLEINSHPGHGTELIVSIQLPIEELT